MRGSDESRARARARGVAPGPDRRSSLREWLRRARATAPSVPARRSTPHGERPTRIPTRTTLRGNGARCPHPERRRSDAGRGTLPLDGRFGAHEGGELATENGEPTDATKDGRSALEAAEVELVQRKDIAGRSNFGVPRGGETLEVERPIRRHEDVPSRSLIGETNRLVVDEVRRRLSKNVGEETARQAKERGHGYARRANRRRASVARSVPLAGRRSDAAPRSFLTSAWIAPGDCVKTAATTSGLILGAATATR